MSAHFVTAILIVFIHAIQSFPLARHLRNQQQIDLSLSPKQSV